MTAFIIFVLLNIMAASSGSIFSPGDWYKSLNRPSWQPADWVFPAVWTVLYLMNAFAGWLVWEAMGTTGAWMVGHGNLWDWPAAKLSVVSHFLWPKTNGVRHDRSRTAVDRHCASGDHFLPDRAARRYASHSHM